jgi:hypothetical protein
MGNTMLFSAGYEQGWLRMDNYRGRIQAIRHETVEITM